MYSEPYNIGRLYLRLLEERNRFLLGEEAQEEEQLERQPARKQISFTWDKAQVYFPFLGPGPATEFPKGWPKRDRIKACFSQAQHYWKSIVFIERDL